MQFWKFFAESNIFSINNAKEWMHFWTFVKDSDTDTCKTPNEWVQYWKFVEDSNLFKCKSPSKWMDKIITIVPVVKGDLPIVMFEHLLTCAKVTDTRMVKNREEYERALLWAKHVRTQDNNAAVANGMTAALDDYMYKDLPEA